MSTVRSVPTRWLVLAGILVALVLAGVVSHYASGDPDGLTRVATDKGFATTEKEHATSDNPLAGYEVDGVEDDRAAGGLAGVVGTVVVLLIAGGLFVVLGRRSRSGQQEA